MADRASHTAPSPAASLFDAPPAQPHSETSQAAAELAAESAETMRQQVLHLLAELITSPAMADRTFLISGYPCDLYVELYEERGWHRADRSMVVFSATARGKRAARSIERVWSNKPLHAADGLFELEAVR